MTFVNILGYKTISMQRLIERYSASQNSYTCVRACVRACAYCVSGGGACFAWMRACERKQRQYAPGTLVFDTRL